MFCLLLYIQRKRRIFGGRVRQHAEHQLAVIAEMRDQHLRVPQREPRRRIGGQQVVQRVQIAAVVGRGKPHTLASTSCSCSRVYSVSASKSSSFILISPEI